MCWLHSSCRHQILVGSSLGKMTYCDFLTLPRCTNGYQHKSWGVSGDRLASCHRVGKYTCPLNAIETGDKHRLYGQAGLTGHTFFCFFTCLACIKQEDSFFQIWGLRAGAVRAAGIKPLSLSPLVSGFEPAVDLCWLCEKSS